MKIAINGFGRIGKNITRHLIEAGYLAGQGGIIELVAINDLGDIKSNAHLLKYDSIHGPINNDISFKDNEILIDKTSIPFFSEKDPSKLPWGDLDVDIVFECTGFFTSREKASSHLIAGAKKVLISAPAQDPDKTIVYGVNHRSLTHNDKVVSNGSCTTNCLAPLAKVLNDSIGIERGIMTTIHSYTGDQPTLDRRHDDLYRARSAATSMIPTSTGAARALGEVLPELHGKLDGTALRVPTPNVSAVDLTFEASNPVTTEEVNSVVEHAAKNDMVKILAYDTEPKVSIDFNHTSHSCIFAPEQTRVVGKHTVRVLAWYDNEWAFSCRMADVASTMGRLL